MTQRSLPIAWAKSNALSLASLGEADHLVAAARHGGGCNRLGNGTQVATYTAGADQEQLAQDAFERLAEAHDGDRRPRR